jgi:hypothetical protein
MRNLPGSAAEFHEPHCETALELTGHGLATRGGVELFQR